jgi:hypothetical protein
MRYSTRHGLTVGIAVGLLPGLMLGVAIGPLQGLLGALLIGGPFGLLTAWVLRRKERVWAEIRAPYESEGLAHHGPASCAHGPGYLMLTTQRLVWMPHLASERDKKIIIAREAITKVRRASLTVNLRIEVYTGESVEFLVRDRRAWMQQLSSVLPVAQVRRE